MTFMIRSLNYNSVLINCIGNHLMGPYIIITKHGILSRTNSVVHFRPVQVLLLTMYSTYHGNDTYNRLFHRVVYLHFLNKVLFCITLNVGNRIGNLTRSNIQHNDNSGPFSSDNAIVSSTLYIIVNFNAILRVSFTR